MLAATAAKLLASLDLDTKPFEAGARRVGGSLGQMESKFSRIGGIARQGVRTAATNIARLGVVAVGAITVAVKSGINSLAELERANQQTAAVIKSTGGKANVSAAQVRQYAEELEKITTADDKLIQSGENLLLTFTNIGDTTFPRATKAMVDMSIALAQGDVASADFKGSAIQLGKALNDPIKGITALRRVGVSFSAAQEDQIKGWAEYGSAVDTATGLSIKLTKEQEKYLKSVDGTLAPMNALEKAGIKLTKEQQKWIKENAAANGLLKAQDAILTELETEFGEAGKAAGTGFGGDMRRFEDAVEDAQMALATGFLPVMRKVATALSTKLADPAVQKQIQDFGVTLAGAFDNLLEIGGKLPWAEIGNSLKIAGAGAKLVLDAFTKLPPWVQTAVLTGWGLNKLTGGALSKIGIELLTGKGGLFSRGGSPAAPMYTKEVGLGGGTGGVAPTGGIGTIGKFFLAAEGIGLILAVKSVADSVSTAATEQAQGIHQTLKESLAGPQSLAELNQKLAGIDQGIHDLNPEGKEGGLTRGAIDELQAMRTEVVAAIVAQTAADKVARDDQIAPALSKAEQKKLDVLRAATEAVKAVVKSGDAKAEAKFDRQRERTEANRVAIKALEQTTSTRVSAVQTATSGVRDRVSAHIAATISTTERIIAALYATRAITNVDVSFTGVSEGYLARQETRRTTMRQGRRG